MLPHSSDLCFCLAVTHTSLSNKLIIVLKPILHLMELVVHRVRGRRVISNVEVIKEKSQTNKYLFIWLALLRVSPIVASSSKSYIKQSAWSLQIESTYFEESLGSGNSALFSRLEVWELGESAK